MVYLNEENKKWTPQRAVDNHCQVIKNTHTHTSSTITTEPLSSQYPNEWMQSSSLDYGYVVTLNADNN